MSEDSSKEGYLRYRFSTFLARSAHLELTIIVAKTKTGNDQEETALCLSKCSALRHLAKTSSEIEMCREAPETPGNQSPPHRKWAVVEVPLKKRL